MASIQQQPYTAAFIASEANRYRSREKILLRTPITAATAIPLPPGTLLYPEGAELVDAGGAPAPVLTGYFLPITVAPPVAGGTAPLELASAILIYATDTRDGIAEAAAIVRDAEVIDAYLMYREQTVAGTGFSALQIGLITAALALNGVITRQGVLAESTVNWPPVT